MQQTADLSELGYRSAGTQSLAVPVGAVEARLDARDVE